MNQKEFRRAGRYDTLWYTNSIRKGHTVAKGNWLWVKKILKLKEKIKMEKHVLKQEDFKEIFSEIVFFRNRKNSNVEIGYIDYGTFKVIKMFLYNGEILNIEGNIFIHTLKRIQTLLTDLDIKDID